MKLIIAGSRTFQCYSTLAGFLEQIKFEIPITEVVSGTCKGADLLGERWAKEHNINIARFPADWKDLSHSDAVIKKGAWGKYDALAGHRRNVKMAKYGDYLTCFIHNNSDGSNDMIQCMKDEGKHGVAFYVTNGADIYKESMAAMFKKVEF